MEDLSSLAVSGAAIDIFLPVISRNATNQGEDEYQFNRLQPRKSVGFCGRN